MSDQYGVDALIPRRRALRLMGMSPRTGDNREKRDPSFPVRVAIGPSRFAYRASDVQRWIDSRPTAPRAAETSQAA